MHAYAALVALHVAAGTIALLSFWAAAGLRKGGDAHRFAGRIYLLAMLAVVATAVPMAGWFYASGRATAGTFLAYLSVITATGMWTGWRAIRDRRDPSRYFGRGFRALAWASIASGAVVFALGLAESSVLLAAFSWVGILRGADMLREARKPERHPRWWTREHYGAMVGNGVATHIAFLALGINRVLAQFGLPPVQLVAWLAPVAVAVAATVWLDRKYGFRGASAAGGHAARAARGPAPATAPAMGVIPAKAGIQ